MHAKIKIKMCGMLEIAIRDLGNGKEERRERREYSLLIELLSIKVSIYLAVHSSHVGGSLVSIQIT